MSARALRTPCGFGLCFALVVGACDDHKQSGGKDAGLTEPSPNASILPAPLASEVPGGAKANGEDGEHRDAGHAPAEASADAPPPEPRALREDRALPSETPHESSGFSLNARLRWLDAAAAPRVPEQNPEGVQRARDAGNFELVIDLSGGRMRFSFASRAFSLPAGSELHARDDLYGHALLWPNHTTYTVLAPGALRSVLSQQRADVVPLVRPRSTALAGGSLFGFGTERVELATPTGKLELEQARAPSSLPSTAIWASGASLCQLLIELVGASPVSSACRADLVPLRAVYTWPNGQHFAFEVTRLTRRADFNSNALSVPPNGAEFRQSELPPPPPMVLLSDGELADFRTRAAARTEKPEPNAPKNGLLLVNHSEGMRWFTVDGAPVARLAAGIEQVLLGLRAGKYQLSARDFFDSEDAAGKSLEVPGRFGVGEDPDKSR
ncbi:MAG TPA: hypothetical protein VFK05_02810 [Polyangiaceae bacterium]|nr:hypothetical protein [Polyangiaceae bacterium]